MKICRFRKDGQISIGLVEGQEMWVCDADLNKTEELWYLDEVEILAPAVPSKVVCVGRNYAEHAKELGNEVPAEPVIFLKPSTSVVGPGDPIVRPVGVGRVDFEGELAVIVGKLVRRLAPE